MIFQTPHYNCVEHQLYCIYFLGVQTHNIFYTLFLIKLRDQKNSYKITGENIIASILQVIWILTNVFFVIGLYNFVDVMSGVFCSCICLSMFILWASFCLFSIVFNYELCSIFCIFYCLHYVLFSCTKYRSNLFLLLSSYSSILTIFITRNGLSIFGDLSKPKFVVFWLFLHN